MSIIKINNSQVATFDNLPLFFRMNYIRKTLEKTLGHAVVIVSVEKGYHCHVVKFY